MPGPTQIAESLWQGDAQKALPSAGASQPPGLESVLEFNTIKINNRQVVDRYRIKQMTGFAGIGVRSSAETNPGDHGETPMENLFDGRTMTISGRIESGNAAKLRDMSMALRSGFTVLKEKPLYLRTSNPNQSDIYINARTIDKIDIVEKQDDLRPWREFIITLRASDPRFYSVATKTADINVSGIDDYAMGTTAVAVNQVGNPYPSTTNGWSANGGTLSAPGNGITRHTANNTGNQGPYYSGASAGGQIQVTAGKTYTASLKLNAFPAGRTFLMSIEWRDAANNVLDRSDLAINAPQAMARYVLTAVAPANSTQVLPTFYHTSSVNADVLDTSEWMFCEGTFSSPFFYPGDGHSKYLGPGNPSASAYYPRPGLVVQARNLIQNPTPQATTGYNTTNATSSIPSAGTIRSTSTAAGTSGLYYAGGSNNVFIPITALQTYTFSVKVTANPSARQFIAQVAWRNGAGTTVSTSSSASTTVAVGNRMTFTATAPAGATQALPVFYAAGVAAAGETYDTTEWALTEGSSAVPTAFVNGDSTRAHWVGARNASVSEYFADNYMTAPFSGFSNNLGGSSWLDSDSLALGNGYITGFRSGAPNMITEGSVTVRIKTPPVISPGEEIGITIKSPDGTAANMLTGRVRVATSTTADLTVVRTTNSIPADLQSSSSFSIAADTTYWLRVSVTATQVIVGFYSVADPDGSGSTLLGSLTYTMTGTTLTVYGGTTRGYYGFRVNTSNRSWRVGSFNLRSTAVNNLDSIRLTNTGNFYAEPKIRFYGPMTNPSFANQTLMLDEDFFRILTISGNIPAGRYYEFDSKKGTLYDDLGVSKLSQLVVSSKPPRLRDGENIIGLIIPSGMGTGFTPKVQVIYQDTWV